MFRRFLIYLTTGSILFAIEGQDPTPRFIPPDFSVEEERVTTPGDLIDFFRDPFVEFLRLDSRGRSIRPKITLSSEQEARGCILYSESGIFAEAYGSQEYFGSDIPRRMLRSIHLKAGYANFLREKFPVGARVIADYGSYRGEYDPSQYSVRAIGEGYIPLGILLISARAGGAREVWTQRPGALVRTQPVDPERQHVANVLDGSITARGAFSEYTGFMLLGGGSRCTRYREGYWSREYQVLSGMGALIFDSRPLRIEVGGEGHKTWSETIFSPHLRFHLVGKGFYAKAQLGSDAQVPSRSVISLSPRVDFPANADYIVTPMHVRAEGYLELKPNQILFGKLDYSTVRGEPVLLDPLAEAPQIENAEVAHQSFTLSLSNDFGTFRNELLMTISSDEVDGAQLPTEPIRVIADTFTADLGRGFEIWAAGERIDLSQIAPKEINDIGVGAIYSYRWIEFHLGVANLLRNDVWDKNALSFSKEIRIWGGVAANLP